MKWKTVIDCKEQEKATAMNEETLGNVLEIKEWVARAYEANGREGKEITLLLTTKRHSICLYVF